jgi:dCMP deaminase
MESDLQSKTKMKQHDRFLRIAEEVAHLSDFERVQIGSILVKNKTIISSGFNQMKTHPQQKERNVLREERKHDCSAIHAEISTLSKVRTVPQGSVLYVARRTKGGKRGMCRPCAACLSMIKEKGIRTIVYNTDGGFAVEHLKEN